MGKLSLFFVSLVGAVPGGYVSFVLIKVFLDRAEKMSTGFQVIAGISLALSGLVTVLPFFILIFTPKKPFGYGEGEEGMLLAAAGAGAVGTGAMLADDDDDGDDVQIDDDDEDFEDDDDLDGFDDDDDDDFEFDDDDDF